MIAMGGDGTIEAVMRGMIGSKVRLGIIPAGSENNIARSLGIPEVLEEACSLIASDNTLKLDIGQVKTRNGKKFVFFEMAIIGLSAAIYPDANKVAGGKLSSIKATAMIFLHQETWPKVFLTFNDESKIELLRYYAAVMDEGYSGDKKVQHYQARKLKVKTSPKLDVMADGVALGRGTVTIKVRPGALRVITTQKRLGLETPQKDAAEILPEPVSPTEGKSHPEESVISLG